MKVYLTESGEHLRTQGEAQQSGEKWDKIDVPTDARGLIAYLNKLRPQPEPQKVDTSTSQYERKGGAIRTLSENHDGKALTEQVVESIMTCGSYTLGRYAMAVSLRYEVMNKKRSKKK